MRVVIRHSYIPPHTTRMVFLVYRLSDLHILPLYVSIYFQWFQTRLLKMPENVEIPTFPDLLTFSRPRDPAQTLRPRDPDQTQRQHQRQPDSQRPPRSPKIAPYSDFLPLTSQKYHHSEKVRENVSQSLRQPTMPCQKKFMKIWKKCLTMPSGCDILSLTVEIDNLNWHPTAPHWVVSEQTASTDGRKE